MKQIYVNEYLKAAQANGLKGQHLDRKYLEQKILGLGSPKIDKALNTKKEDLEIPEEWMKVIQKPDGSWKKIIFYNTGISALLQYNEKWVDKIEDVLKVFKENQDDVALLWRPHPLIENTMKSMRPGILQKYLLIKQQYLEEGWGIYDDTVDLDRAIALSDAYYGDRSSVVQLFENIKRPILIQNPFSLDKNGDSLAMDNIIKYGEQFLFFNEKDNALYLLNKDITKATLIKLFPMDRQYMECPILYGKIVLFQEKVFLIPFSARKIGIYNIKKDEMKYLEYPAECYFRGQIFSDYVVKDNILYLIPCAFSSIVCIDMESEQVISVKDLGDKTANYAFGGIWENESEIYFTSITDNKIFKLDVKNDRIESYASDDISSGCCAICGDDVNVWIIPKETNKILRWDRKNKKIYKHVEFPFNYIAGEWSFCKVIKTSSYLYLLPRNANMCLQVDISSNLITEVKLIDNPLKKRDSYFQKYMPLSNLFQTNELVYIFESTEGYVYEIGENVKKEKINIELDKHISNLNAFTEIGMEQESKVGCIRSFLDYIVTVD